MKKFLLITVLLGTVVLNFSGCERKPAAENSQQAIEQSKTKGTVQEQSDYLADQAEAFLNNENYQEAMKTANYVLTSLDSQSQEAKSVIEKTTAEMRRITEQKTEDVKKSLGNFGKE